MSTPDLDDIPLAVPFAALVTRECEGCSAPVYAGGVAAWLPSPDWVVCVDCADRADREATA